MKVNLQAGPRFFENVRLHSNRSHDSIGLLTGRRKEARCRSPRGNDLHLPEEEEEKEGRRID